MNLNLTISLMFTIGFLMTQKCGSLLKSLVITMGLVLTKTYRNYKISLYCIRMFRHKSWTI